MMATVLNGGIVGVKSFVESGGKSGCAIWFVKASTTKRSVWISTGVSAQLPGVIDVFRRCSAAAGSRIRLLDGFAEFSALVTADMARPRRQQRPMDAIAIVTSAEKWTKFEDFSNVCTVKSLIDLLSRTDKSKSVVGVCGFKGNVALS